MKEIRWEEDLYEDEECPSKFEMVAMRGNLIAAIGEDKCLRIWSTNQPKTNPNPKRLQFQEKINALKVFDSNIFVATENRVSKIGVQENGETISLTPPKKLSMEHIVKMRVCLDSILFISSSEIFERTKSKTLKYSFASELRIIDARIFCCKNKRRLIVVCRENRDLVWYVLKTPGGRCILSSSAKWETLLDISCRGRLFVHNGESNFNVLDPLIKKDPWTGSCIGSSCENNYGGAGCFLELDENSEQVLFAGIKYSELAIAEKYTPEKEISKLLKPLNINVKRMQRLIEIREEVDDKYLRCERDNMPFNKPTFDRVLLELTDCNMILEEMAIEVDGKLESFDWETIFESFKKGFLELSGQKFNYIDGWQSADMGRDYDEELFPYLDSSPSGVALVLNEWRDQFSKVLCLRYCSAGKSLEDLPSLRRIYEVGEGLWEQDSDLEQDLDSEDSDSEGAVRG